MGLIGGLLATLTSDDCDACAVFVIRSNDNFKKCILMMMEMPSATGRFLSQMAFLLPYNRC